MPRVSYFVDDGQIDYDITRNDIDSCSDQKTLEEWARGLEDLLESVTMQTDAWHLYPKTDQQSLLWLGRANQAKAATAIGLKRVRKRLRDLGFLLPDAHQKEVIGMHVKIRELQEKLSNATAEVELLKSQKGIKK